jgi:hypothetical protein
MDHHLKANLTGLGRRLMSDCSLHAFLEVQDRVLKILEDKDKTEEIKQMIDSARTVGRYDFENRQLDSWVAGSVCRNRHYYKVTHNNGEELWVDGMSAKMRGKVPNYNDSVVLGSFLAGVDAENIEGANMHHKEFVKETLGDLAKSIGWYKRDSFQIFKEKDDAGEYQESINKRFKSNLSEISYALSGAKKIIHFDVVPTIEKLDLAIKNIKSIDKEINKSKEFNILEKEIDNTINFLENLSNPKVKKKKTLKI